MDSLYERCRQNKLIFTKLQPQTSPEPSEVRRPAQNGSPQNSSELEEIFNRRVATPTARMGSNGRTRIMPGERDLDSDLDEAQSELGSDIYSEAGSISRRSTKMNRLVDLIQREKVTPTRARDAESTPQSSPQLTSPNTTLIAPAEPVSTQPKLSMTSVAESTSKLGKIYDSFYWNVLTIVSVAVGFVLTELVLKQTIKLFQFLKDPIERQLSSIWNDYLATLGTPELKKHAWFGRHLKGVKVRGIELEHVLTVAIMVPMAAFLLVAYAFVWILYILNVAMLTEIQLF